MEECLQVLTWQGVVVEASGNVFVTPSDKMDNLVMKGIVDADQLLAACSALRKHTLHAVCAYAAHTHTHTHTHTDQLKAQDDQ